MLYVACCSVVCCSVVCCSGWMQSAAGSPSPVSRAKCMAWYAPRAETRGRRMRRAGSHGAATYIYVYVRTEGLSLRMAERTCMSVGMRSSTGSLSRLAHVVTESANDVSRPNESGEYLSTTTGLPEREYSSMQRRTVHPLNRSPARLHEGMPPCLSRPPGTCTSQHLHARYVVRRSAPCAPGVVGQMGAALPFVGHAVVLRLRRHLGDRRRRQPIRRLTRQRWYGISRRTASATAARRHAMHARPH